MFFDYDFDYVHSQKILLTPKLKQALNILEMTSGELFEYARQQVVENMALEFVEGSFEFPEFDTEGFDAFPDESEEDYNGGAVPDCSFKGRLRHKIDYIVPDIIVRNIGDKLEILINEEAFPLLTIKDPREQVSACWELNGLEKNIRSSLNDAAWLINCIELRKAAIKKAAECIINSNLLFFKKGRKYLNKINLEDAARELDIHRYILEQTVRGKFLQCFWGTFEMECFFSYA